ncbi:MAG: 6-carboxytetrahydropterin synthase [Candidatus Omnitrophica bacterium]|nr:6-carboxytetrahydropterin synthase [Candidatus Omnitrophota bacterium]
MYAVTKVIEFCYGHRLLNYQGKCRYLHGHNGKVEIELSSRTLDRRGMVRDFDEIKRVVQAWIDQELDHKMLLHRDDPVAPLLRERHEPVFLLDDNPTAEAIARLIFEHAASQGFPVTCVRVWETERSVAAYRPDAAVRRRPRAGRRAARRRAAARSISTAA